MLRHLRRPQPRPSFIMCFDPLLGTRSVWGSTVVVNHCVGVGFQLLLLLLNKIQQDDLSAAWPSFLNVVFLNLFVTSTQCRKHSLNWVCSKIVCKRSPLVSSMFSNLSLYTLPGVHHISLFFYFIGRPASFFPWNCKLVDYDLLHLC